MSLWNRLLDGSLMPHGYCLLWREDLVFLHLGGDLITSMAYFAIPLALVSLVKKRDDLKFDKAFLMFALFIFLCGITHLVSIINLWHGYYFVEGLFKITTGIVSMLTAIMIWRLLPAAIAIPSKAELQQKLAELQAAKKHLAEANQQLEQKVIERTRELEHIASTDALTGVFNRREMIARLRAEIEGFDRDGRAFSILMIDLDNFKSINDSYGHLAGDQVLQRCAEVLASQCRGSDLISRFGGEEFLILLPRTDLSEAQLLAQRYCVALYAESIRIDVHNIRVSCSIGVAQKSLNGDKSTLLRDADQALYQAKRDGKNCVRVSVPR